MATRSAGSYRRKAGDGGATGAVWRARSAGWVARLQSGTMAHIARHAFAPDEVEEVFAGAYKVRRGRDGLYFALGETLSGRLAFVVFQRIAKGAIRVVTARDMNVRERRMFRRK
jgi:uncharacterized protein